VQLEQVEVKSAIVYREGNQQVWEFWDFDHDEAVGVNLKLLI